MAQPRREKADYKSRDTGPTQYDSERKSLLDLPPEPWSKIGHLVISNRKIHNTSAVILKHRIASKHHGSSAYATTGLPSRASAELLREELLPLWFKTKVHIVICLSSSASEISLIGQWLRAVSAESRKLIYPAAASTWGTRGPTELRNLLGVETRFVQVPDSGAGVGQYRIEFV
ncbi:hypothetical protein CLAFUW4_12692 [Fulvia fulva]|nr:hypothetical protein CLAFUR4_12697 [Fulvia fulva]WPV21152.1 hypothetical protein CLAFUW4_12692 [Fulvia fulva]